jgi:hypothetical protein
VLEGEVRGVAGMIQVLISPLNLASVEHLGFVAAGSGLIGPASLPAEAHLTISRGGLGVGRLLPPPSLIGAVTLLSLLTLALLRLAIAAFALTLLTLTLLTLTLLTLTLLTLTLLTLTLLTLARLATAA